MRRRTALQRDIALLRAGRRNGCVAATCASTDRSRCTVPFRSATHVRQRGIPRCGEGCSTGAGFMWWAGSGQVASPDRSGSRDAGRPAPAPAPASSPGSPHPG
eukprot:scaffold1035_cov374-Prasinococcus_capsulatus_cf.AAC.8